MAPAAPTQVRERRAAAPDLRVKLTVETLHPVRFPQLEEPAGPPPSAGPAVEDRTRSGAGLGEDGVHLGEGVAAVDDEGPVMLPGKAYVVPERLDLGVAVGQVPVEVEPRLSDGGDDAGQILDSPALLAPALGVVRVQPGGGEDTAGETGRQLDRGLRGRQVGAGRDNPLHLPSAVEKLHGTACVELEMAVRVDPTHRFDATHATRHRADIQG